MLQVYSIYYILSLHIMFQFESHYTVIDRFCVVLMMSVPVMLVQSICLTAVSMLLLYIL